ncbi:MAG: hypothetical protein ABFC62_03995 [Clostridiaceae bacterium]|nr:hypothetical protein [Eubacteriales bacterium]
MNNKSKVSYHLSKSEFWMLIILVLVVVVALSVIYLITPATDALAITQQEYEAANTRLQLLRQDNARLQEYLEQEAAANAELEALKLRMPDYYSQEITLATFDALSEKNMLEIVSVSFEGVKTDPRAAFLAQIKHESVKSDEQPSANANDYIRYETIQLGFSGTYSALYGFIGDLENEARAIFMRELVISRAEEGAVTGGLTLLVMSGAEAEGDEYPNYDYGAPAATGKADPFAAFPGYIEGGDAELGEQAAPSADFYIILNSYNDNAGKASMGRYLQASSEVASQNNARLNASLTVSEDNGVIRYSYELDGKKYSGAILPNEEHPRQIVVSVLSRARVDANDRVGVQLSVTNNTALTVVVDVRNDDAASPRFLAGTMQGTVQIGR